MKNEIKCKRVGVRFYVGFICAGLLLKYFISFARREFSRTFLGDFVESSCGNFYEKF